MSKAKLTLNRAATHSGFKSTPTSNDGGCGTGAGGFKPGNKCAKGGGSAKGKTPGDVIRGSVAGPGSGKPGDSVAGPGGLHSVAGPLKYGRPQDSVAGPGGLHSVAGPVKYVHHTPAHKIKKFSQSEINKILGNAENPMELLTSNFYGKTRRETLNGTDYIVVPLTMVVPGVLNGSRGPLLYPKSELKKDPMAWNNMPIVVNHPRNAFGNPVSARQPEVLEKVGIGTVFNTEFRDKLRAEGWFDIEKTKRVAPEILENILNRRPHELSTGLFTDNEQAQGVFNYGNGKAKKYQFIARNHRPDHLAILTDEPGACSVEDGCGVGVENAGGGGCGTGAGGFKPGNSCAKGGGGGYEGQPKDRDFAEGDRVRISKHYGGGRGHVTEVHSQNVVVKTKKGHVILSKADVKYVHHTPAHKVKKFTQSEIDKILGNSELNTLLTKLSRNARTRAKYADVIELLTNADTLYQAKSMSHAFGNDKAMDEMGAKPMKKKRKKMMNGDHSGSPSCNLDSGEPDMAKLTDKQREQIVDSLITNACSCKNKGKCGCKDKGVFQEEDREGLEGMSDERLVQMNNALVENGKKVAVVNSLVTDGIDVGKDHYVLNDDGTFVKAKKGAKPAKKDKAADPDEDEDEGEEGVANNAEQNEEKWLKNAPTRIKGIVRNAMRLEDEQREQLIETITTNSNNRYTEEQLTAMETDDLENLAALAGPAANSYEDEDEEVKPRRRPNYLGAGVPSGGATHNRRFSDEDVLVPPTEMALNEETEEMLSKRNKGFSKAGADNN